MKLDPKDCINYYCNQAGGTIFRPELQFPLTRQLGTGNYFAGQQIQRGYGFFGDLFRKSIPILSKVGKYLGRKALNFASNVGSDVISGKSFKESTKSHLKDIGSEIKDDVIKKVQGGSGIKRKRVKRLIQSQNKRRKLKDIFSE